MYDWCRVLYVACLGVGMNLRPFDRSWVCAGVRGLSLKFTIKFFWCCAFRRVCSSFFVWLFLTLFFLFFCFVVCSLSSLVFGG